MKISVNAPFSEENYALIVKAAQGCEVVRSDCSGADIVIGYPATGADYSNLKLFQSTSAGVEKLLRDNIPENIIVTNTTGAFGDVISEYVIGGILSLYRGLFGYRDNQVKHIWQQKMARELTLKGKQALILGCGDLGSKTAQKLKAFGVKTLGIRKTPSPVEGIDEVYGVSDLNKIIPESDLVICCLPNTPLTDGLVGKEQFALMKQDAMFVNVGRGNVVDTDALIETLKSGKLFGAVLDVFDIEPLPEKSPLWDMENVLITPHISGPSFGHFPEVEKEIAEICAENILRFLSGKPLLNVVNRKSGYAEKSTT